MANSFDTEQTSTDPHGIQRVAVIGAGTMGRGIALSFLIAGYPTRLLDSNPATLEDAHSFIQQTSKRLAQRGSLSPEQASAIETLASYCDAYDAIADSDLVIEAVYENLELKQQIFARLDRLVKADTLLATNTSYLDVEAIADSTSRPERVLGLHFFSPAHIMKLLEIVHHPRTSEQSLTQARGVAERLGKVAVLAANAHGFIGNRMLQPYVTQARRLLLEGALPSQVDQALEAFGMAMGPFRMYDVVGIDLEWRARKMAGDQPAPDSEEGRLVWEDNALCERERFGQKSGRGFYRYEAGNRTPIVDPEVEAIVLEASRQLGFERREISDQEIVERCLLALVNEGARVLEEGVARCSGDIDLVYQYGYGFPASRVGPMHYADQRGASDILRALQAQHERDPELPYWQPAALWFQLADQNTQLAHINN